jgi:hypothetical protein
MPRTVLSFLIFLFVSDCKVGYSQIDISSCSYFSCPKHSTRLADPATSTPVTLIESISKPTPISTQSLSKDATDSDHLEAGQETQTDIIVITSAPASIPFVSVLRLNNGKVSALPVATPVHPTHLFNTYSSMSFTTAQTTSTFTAPPPSGLSSSTDSTMTKSSFLSPNSSAILIVSPSSVQHQTESTSKSMPGLIAVATLGWTITGMIILIMLWKRHKNKRRSVYKYKVNPLPTGRRARDVTPYDPIYSFLSSGYRFRSQDRQEGVSPGPKRDSHETSEDEPTYVAMLPGPEERLHLAVRQGDIPDDTYCNVMSTDPRGGLQYEELPVEFRDNRSAKLRKRSEDITTF